MKPMDLTRLRQTAGPNRPAHTSDTLLRTTVKELKRITELAQAGSDNTPLLSLGKDELRIISKTLTTILATKIDATGIHPPALITFPDGLGLCMKRGFTRAEIRFDDNTKLFHVGLRGKAARRTDFEIKTSTPSPETDGSAGTELPPSLFPALLIDRKELADAVTAFPTADVTLTIRSASVELTIPSPPCSSSNHQVSGRVEVPGQHGKVSPSDFTAVFDRVYLTRLLKQFKGRYLNLNLGFDSFHICDNTTEAWIKPDSYLCADCGYHTGDTEWIEESRQHLCGGCREPDSDPEE